MLCTGCLILNGIVFSRYEWNSSYSYVEVISDHDMSEVNRKCRLELVLDCPLSKENQAPTQKFERPNRKLPKSEIFLPRSRISAPSSHESSMKPFLRRFELNQNKSKHMKINDIFANKTNENQ